MIALRFFRAARRHTGAVETVCCSLQQAPTNVSNTETSLPANSRWLSSAATWSPTSKDARKHDVFNDFSKRVRHLAKKGSGSATGERLRLEEFSTKSMEKLMTKSVEHFQGELSSVRTGRATPGMLDHLVVVGYGDKLPLKAVGTVSVKDPQLLGVSVFDPDLVDAVVKAIRESPLNLNPSAEGSEVLVPIPRATKESLEGLAKVVAKEAEKCKVSIRNARKVGLEECKSLASDDERKRAEKTVQNVTDKYIAEVEKLRQAKEIEILPR